MRHLSCLWYAESCAVNLSVKILTQLQTHGMKLRDFPIKSATVLLHTGVVRRSYSRTERHDVRGNCSVQAAGRCAVGKYVFLCSAVFITLNLTIVGLTLGSN